MKHLIIFLLLFSSCNYNAFATTDNLSNLTNISKQDLEIENVKLHNYKKDFFKMLGSLTIIVSLAVGSVILLKKFNSSKISTSNKNNIIKIIERRSLSHKNNLYIVSVYDQEFIIADSPTGINSIIELKDNTDLSKNI